MSGDPLAFNFKCHPKAQRAPGEIFETLLSYLRIFLIPRYSIKKTKKKYFLRILERWHKGSYHLGFVGGDRIIKNKDSIPEDGRERPSSGNWDNRGGHGN